MASAATVREIDMPPQEVDVEAAWAGFSAVIQRLVQRQMQRERARQEQQRGEQEQARECAS